MIGFYHEHSRPDRNEYIEVKYDNVDPSFRNEFGRYVQGATNLLGYGYDHASIMHYAKDDFSVNGNDTIVSKDPTVPIGGAWELSPLDILKTNKLYNCSKFTQVASYMFDYSMANDSLILRLFNVERWLCNNCMGMRFY